MTDPIAAARARIDTLFAVFGEPIVEASRARLLAFCRADAPACVKSTPFLEGRDADGRAAWPDSFDFSALRSVDRPAAAPMGFFKSLKKVEVIDAE